MIRKNDKISDFVVLPFCYFIHCIIAFIRKNKKISTHLLTVLITSVILRIEQKINGYLNIDKYPFVKEERV